MREAVRKFGMELHVAESEQDLPEQVRRQVQRDHISDALACFCPGSDEIWLVRRNVADSSVAFEITLHEAFHRGLCRVYGGSQLRRPLLQFLLENSEDVRLGAVKVQATQPNLSELQAVDEALAIMAQTAGRLDLHRMSGLLVLVQRCAWQRRPHPIEREALETFVAAIRLLGLPEWPRRLAND